MGFGEESDTGESGGRGTVIARRVVNPAEAVTYRVLTLSLSCIEIYRAEPTRRRECLYYLALGHYKMGNYNEAKRFNGAQFSDVVASFPCHSLLLPIPGLLIDKEPTNMQALSLATLIDKAVMRGSHRLVLIPLLSS
jgi:hypothetical protein